MQGTVYISHVENETDWPVQLGEWESSYKDVVNDEDNADDNELNDPKRGPSPLPTIPVPTEFCDLTISEQFTYTKPVLVAILHCEYPPAKDRHDNFIRGGTARKTVTDNACERGVIIPEDIDKLQGHLLWWALRDERRAKRIDDGDALPGEVEALPGPSVDLDQLEVEMKSVRASDHCLEGLLTDIARRTLKRRAIRMVL